jgi:hypothetical protein
MQVDVPRTFVRLTFDIFSQCDSRQIGGNFKIEKSMRALQRLNYQMLLEKDTCKGVQRG